MRNTLGIIAMIVLLLAPGQVHAQGPRFKVIVNAQNSVNALPAPEISRIFLGHATRWPDGALIEPVDLADDSPVHARFVSDIHHKDAAALSSYWQQQIFSGKDVPPPAVAKDADVLAYVRSHAGAIGYVSADTPTDPAVKVIIVTYN